MNFPSLGFHFRMLLSDRQSHLRIFSRWLSILVAVSSCLLLLLAPPALAGLKDDNFDGNVFVLYAGNGSLVPPRVTLADSFKQSKPALLVFYVDDSSDCKQYVTVVSRLQAFYGRAADLIPVSVDSIPTKSTYTPEEPGYYYKGFVPQTVLLNQKGEVVLNEKGNVSFERVDDEFRKVFNLAPRSESVDLKRKSFNEFNTELSR